jgi:7-cyano-7-deazaguanine synthase
MSAPATAVLLSGGLDSAVLVAEEAARAEVHPLYVKVGLAWEAAEHAMLTQLLRHRAYQGRVRPIVALAVDMTDVYPTGHWAMTGRPPAYHTPDEDVYLPGRNIALLSKAAMHCAVVGVHRLAVGTLAHNPFPDATPAFRLALAHALSLGLAHQIQIDAPYAQVGKADVIRRGRVLDVPFEFTLSCMNPQFMDRADLVQHCGLCSKCHERHDAFVAAGVADPTSYQDRSHVGPGR